MQVNEFDPVDGPKVPLPDTTYSYTYRYGARPHAVVSTGVFTYTYDADGNMTTAKSEKLDRALTWDEEDRLIKTLDNRVETVYAYDDAGTRVLTRGLWVKWCT